VAHSVCWFELYMEPKKTDVLDISEKAINSSAHDYWLQGITKSINMYMNFQLLWIIWVLFVLVTQLEIIEFKWNLYISDPEYLKQLKNGFTTVHQRAGPINIPSGSLPWSSTTATSPVSLSLVIFFAGSLNYLIKWILDVVRVKIQKWRLIAHPISCLLY
jgi:hypothetical protein